DAELMFDLGPDAGLVAVPCAFLVSQFPVAATLGLSEVPGVRRTVGDSFLLASVGRITPNRRLLPMQEIRQYPGVVHIGRGRNHRVDKFRAAVDTNMGFHAEVPLVALARLAHLRVALLLLVLGGT